jgi:hypothetical protein
MKLEEVWPLLREGARIMNADWDSGMYIVWQAGYPNGIPINQNTAEATGIPEGTVKKFQPYIMLHDAHGDFVPYVMSQSDMTSTFWQVAPNYDPPFSDGPHYEPGGYDDLSC